jgi:DNA polymerase III subunit epsilon
MDFIAFDLETTGTVAGVDRIVELGAVRFINGEVEAAFSTLVNPGLPIPPEATRVNKITNDMVKGKPAIDCLLKPFTDFCGSLPLVAHNAPFDTAFLLSDYKLYQNPAPRGIILDTLPIARKLLPGLPNYRLGTLVTHFNIASGDFHRAQEDATYCGYLFLNLLRKIHDDISQIDTENLVRLTGRQAHYFPLIERQPQQLDLFSL